MGFQPGPIDGDFGGLTRAAVWAYESVVEGTFYLDTTGVVTPERWLAMQDPLPVVARRPDAGKHTEIYLPEQVIVVFDGADAGVHQPHLQRRAGTARRRLHEGQGVV